MLISGLAGGGRNVLGLSSSSSISAIVSGEKGAVGVSVAQGERGRGVAIMMVLLLCSVGYSLQCGMLY